MKTKERKRWPSSAIRRDRLQRDVLRSGGSDDVLQHFSGLERRGLEAFGQEK